jgi:hypothetical protein
MWRIGWRRIIVVNQTKGTGNPGSTATPPKGHGLLSRGAGSLIRALARSVGPGTLPAESAGQALIGAAPGLLPDSQEHGMGDLPAGITGRRDAAGAVRYRVRVRGANRTRAATFAGLATALVFRAKALAAAQGRGRAPGATLRTAPPIADRERAVTVEQASAR